MNKSIQISILVVLSLIWLAQLAYMPVALSILFLMNIVALALYYDKTNNCISSGIETRKVIRYNGDLEKGYTEIEIPVLFHICPLGHKMGESGL